MKTLLKCDNCLIEFYDYPSRHKKKHIYCSPDCYRKGGICGKAGGRKPIHGESVILNEEGKKVLSPEYNTWRHMRMRCTTNENSRYYRNYYGRCIRIYPPWKKSFAAFLIYLLSTIGRRPSDEYSLDRINNDGNYEPGNLRWSTSKEQANNRRQRTAVNPAA